MKLIKLASLLALVASIVSGCGGAINSKVGVTVSGLSGNSTLGLKNNFIDTLSITSNGDYSFATTLAPGAQYNVTVSQQPNGQICTVANGVNTISSSGGDVTGIQVTCEIGTTGTTAFPVNIIGLAAGNTLVIQSTPSVSPNNITLLGTTTTAAGQVQLYFPYPVTQGNTYVVSVVSQSQVPAQTCTVSNTTYTIPSTGTVSPASVVCQ